MFSEIHLTKMDLVKILLIAFGLSLKYKVMDQILNGLIISMLSFLSLFFISTMPLIADLWVGLEKLCSLCFPITTVCGYILLKRRIKKYYGMYGEISAFDVRFRRNRGNLTWSNLMFFLCFGMCYISSMNFDFNNEIYSVQTDNIKFYLYHHIPFTGFIFNLLIFGMIYLIFELCDRYYNLLDFSNKFIERYLKYEPNFEIRYQVLEVIKKFDENENDFKLIVYPMRKIFLILFISLFIRVLFCFHNSIEITSKLSCLSFIFFIILYYMYTQIVIYYKSKVKSLLLSNIDTWINSPYLTFVGRIITKPKPISDVPSFIDFETCDCLSDVD